MPKPGNRLLQPAKIPSEAVEQEQVPLHQDMI